MEWSKFRLLGLYTRLTQPRAGSSSSPTTAASLHDCDADVGARTGDHWWSAAINTPQVPGGLGWTKELAVKRREYLTSSAHIKGKAAPQHRAARSGRT